MAIRLERLSGSSSNDYEVDRSSFGVGRIRSSSIDGYHPKSFNDCSYKYPDWNASTMGIKRNGKTAILAARRGFLVVDFDNPNNPKKINCNIKWEPASLEWNPHQKRENWFATVMNQKIDIWDADRLSGSSVVLHTLSGHTRAISDTDWNFHDAESLLTCSMDTYINLWDLRDSRKPAGTFTTVAGSSQVKWNRVNKHLFASAHDGDIRIWDTRKGNIPAVYIAGHLSKIHGLDWCPQKEEHFVTASIDCTVKFWNMNSPKQQLASINNGAPVWKARYTPFGNGLVTMLVPQLRRTENTLFLWNTSEFKSPVHKFSGHSDVILEFQWRSQRKDDYEEYQLVSWSKDQTLRLWKANKKIVQAIEGEEYTASGLDDDDVPVVDIPSALVSSPTTIRSRVKELASSDPFHFDTKPTNSNNKTSALSPSTPPMMASTYEEMANFKSPSNAAKIARSTVSTQSPSVKPIAITKKPTTPDRPEQLTLMDLKLIDTKPCLIQSPGPISPPARALSPLSGNRTAFRMHGKQSSFSPPSSGGVNDMTPLQALRQEFTLLNLNSPIFNIEKLDWENRLCLVASRPSVCYFTLHITFPFKYPDKVKPDFQFSKESNINEATKTKIINAMMDVSEQHVKFNRPCLEPCLRQLRYLIEELHVQDPNDFDNQMFKQSDTGADLSYVDSTVPFPRTCGARFCSVGDVLVVFSRPEKYNNIVVVERSLRSMSALNNYLQNLEQSEETRGETYKAPKSIGLVYVSNTSVLIPISKQLAQSYSLTGNDPIELCKRNASLAASVNRKDLIQTWNLLANVLDGELYKPMDSGLVPRACHPLGRRLVNSLLDYYERLKDVQTLAVMSCILAKNTQIPVVLEDEKISKKISVTSDDNPCTRFVYSSPDYSPYNLFEKTSMEEKIRDILPDYPPFDEEKRNHQIRQNEHILNSSLLDSKDTFRYDQFKRNYAEILYRWDLQTQRTEVLKFCSEQLDENEGLSFEEICLECSTCQNSQRKPCCINCKSIIVKCSVCRIGVRGLMSFCMVCGHGGHMFHLIDWFHQKDWCPAGCGCYCLKIGQFASKS